MKPLVSILIPAFNAQEWIADTIRSALGQTWPGKEILVVDDGSTDGTVAIARRFASKDVAVVTGKHEGAAATRNEAFSLCNGNYIQWLDADDLLSPDKIVKQVEAAERRDAERALLSSGWGSFMYRARRARFRPTQLWADLTPAEWVMRKFEHNLYMPTSTWLASRELTEAAGPWDTRLVIDDDGEYFSRVLLASEGVRFVANGSVLYRRSGAGSLSYIANSDAKLEAQLLSMRLQIGYLRRLDDSQRAHRAAVQYLQNSLLSFFPERPDLVQEARRMAGELGGRLEEPELSRKYAWIRHIFGWRLAKRARVWMPRLRWSLMRACDRALAWLEGERHN